jgi:hypothetical protein
MQMQKRMADQRKFTPNDHNFYIMQLDTGLYVDGKHIYICMYVCVYVFI